MHLPIAPSIPITRVFAVRVVLGIAAVGAAGLGVAGCGTDLTGLGGTGGGTGSQGGATGGAGAFTGGGGGSMATPGADAATDGCAGLPIPAIACAFGRPTPICALIVSGDMPAYYRWIVTCPDQPPPVDAAVDMADAPTGSPDAGMGGADAAPGTVDAGRTDGAGDADVTDVRRADAGDAGTGAACASSPSCGAGQVCTTVDGVCNAPPGCATGMVCTTLCYGTCRPADTGPACGNTICGAGTTCCNASCGTCVAPGAGCTKQLCVAPTCEKDSDCAPVADYCTGCDCRALTKGTSLPACPGPGVRCLVDPCLNKVSTCVNQQCVVAVKG